jgi:hypothetical protein
VNALSPLPYAWCTVLLLLCASGCGESAQIVPPPCTPGGTNVCVCADNRAGRQVCQPDRTFGDCVCSEPIDTGPDLADTEGVPDATDGVDEPDPDHPDAAGVTLTSGRYFMAASLSGTPQTPVFLELTATVATVGGVTTADFVLQPLKTDLDSRGDPRPDARTPAGGFVTVQGLPVGGSAFTFEVAAMTFDGESNPVVVGMSFVVEGLYVSGRVLDAERLCGTLSGQLTHPLQQEIDDAPFGATKHGGDFTELGPEPLRSCPGS